MRQMKASQLLNLLLENREQITVNERRLEALKSQRDKLSADLAKLAEKQALHVELNGQHFSIECVNGRAVIKSLKTVE